MVLRFGPAGAGFVIGQAGRPLTFSTGAGLYSTVVLFGDSITAQNTGVALPFYNAAFNSWGYWTVANAILGWPMRLLNNAGVSGNGTDQMLARLDADVLAYSPEIVIGLAGTNNPSRGISAAQTISDLTDIFTRLRNGGVKKIVWGTITPRSDQGSGGLLTFIQTVNAWLRTTPLIDVCVDYYATWADASNSNLPYPNFTYDSAPAIHPSPRGATAMAVALANAIRSFVKISAPLNSNDQAFREYASNPAGIGNNASGTNGWTLATGITGNGPNGWTARRRSTGTGVASKATGDVAQIVASFAANSDGAGFCFGGDDVLAVGRYDQAWTASAARTYPYRTRPTVANGYTYKLVVPGTTGATQPTWPTNEGDLVADGSVVWVCQRMPQTGDVFRAMVDVEFSGQAASTWATPTLVLGSLDTAGASMGTTIGMNFDFTGAMGIGADSQPQTRIVTPDMTIAGGNGIPRYLRATILDYGQAAGGATMKVKAASIWRVS